jgi:hypothetical protein
MGSWYIVAFCILCKNLSFNRHLFIQLDALIFQQDVYENSFLRPSVRQWATAQRIFTKSDTRKR